MNVRYFAAARAAAGMDEENFNLPSGATVADLLQAPPLARILSRSSFLLNEVAVRDHCRVLEADDVVDVLPPFAGG